MEVTKSGTFSCGITILCLISLTVAFPRHKRQVYGANPWFGGEFEGGPMAGGPFSYQPALFAGNGLPGMPPFSQRNSAGVPGVQQFSPRNSAGVPGMTPPSSINSAAQRMAGPRMMFGQGVEVEPTQPAEIEPAEGAMFLRPTVGISNVQPANPALQNSPTRQQFPNNNINRGLPAMPFGMAGPMGEVEAAQAPDIEPAEVMMPMNNMRAIGGTFPTNSMWNNLNSFQQYPFPSQATPPSFYDFGMPVVPAKGTVPVAGNGYLPGSPRASLSNIVRPQINPVYSPNPNPAEMPVLRNPLRAEASLSIKNVPVSIDAPSIIPQNPPQSYQAPLVAQGSSVMAVQPQPLPIIPAVNAQTDPSAGLVATPAPAPAPVFQITRAPQAPPPVLVPNSPPVNSGPAQVGPVVVPPRGSAQAPPPATRVGEFEPTQAPDIEPIEASVGTSQARVQVQSRPFQPSPVASPMKVVVDQAGVPPQNPLSGPQWNGYMF